MAFLLRAIASTSSRYVAVSRSLHRGISLAAALHHHSTNFSARHIGPRHQEYKEMAELCGVKSVDDLVKEAIPQHLVDKDWEMKIAPQLQESEFLAKMQKIAKKNQAHIKSMIGQGFYGVEMPAVVQRNMLENPGYRGSAAWYTAYTPYQAEISQGRLEMLFNYQTMITDMTHLEVSNASLLDDATAAAEAMSMCFNITKKKKKTFFVEKDTHPHILAVLKTRSAALNIALEIGDVSELKEDEVCGVLISYPSSTGTVHVSVCLHTTLEKEENVQDHRALADRVHKAGALLVASTDLLACALLAPPGEFGADIACGSNQRFGLPMMYGGPHAGFIATTKKNVRQIPGRIIGLTKDAGGGHAFRMSLQAREQHIRRQSAVSNICTAQSLLANMSAAFAMYHGPDGIRGIAQRAREKATFLAASLQSLGHRVAEGIFFDTLSVEPVGRTPEQVVAAALELGINLLPSDVAGRVGIACDQTTTLEDLEKVVQAFGGNTVVTDVQVPDLGVLARTSSFLTDDVFNSAHSETEMMRVLQGLARKDYGLDRGMIPLGSCTMKLNAASIMMPITWPEFTNIHPFAPPEQAAGYHEMIDELDRSLQEITGFAGFSFQPNAGSQGEYTGLAVVRAYHDARGDQHRTVCLLPTSAHGTNPASAVMAGMKVGLCVFFQQKKRGAQPVSVKCTTDGQIDMDDLKKQCEKHSDKLAAIMVTYPSTYGVFDEDIKDVCDLIHKHGGQVYLDGANMNAMVGHVQPASVGADVCHLNLHKTFAIPHGGGGPGVGPTGVAAHLVPYLPTHSSFKEPLATSMGSVSSAPYGSAGILPITYGYISMMGKEGLKEATSVGWRMELVKQTPNMQLAILNANYMLTRLKDHFPIRYVNEKGRCAHEFIVTLKQFEKLGVSTVDIAKRLMDYGFHGPTMSWPVPSSLMVEPTESEPKKELDRLCDALLSIREEIREVEIGNWPKEDNPLHHAPHTQELVIADEWDHPYGRELAAFPVEGLRSNKPWPTVRRVDDVHGDRNLVLTLEEARKIGY